MKRGSFILFLCCSTFLQAQPITTKVLNPPNRLRCNEAAPKLNQVLFGATPPNSDDKPVVVFVHGWFDNGYAWFMTGNDWYKRCYDAGYRSAFFFQSPSGTFQDNGQVVADMIRETCRHYNTSSVVAVCHSKGGFDIEWALYNSNMWDSVQGVITLSTPYWGAPMADLIANPGIRSALVLVPFVGSYFEGEGTYQMQPAYMAGVVRPMLDNHPNNRPEKFHCFGSWGHDHILRIPNPAGLDILMVVFPDARPSCNPIPGFNVLAGNLMSGFMNITGQLSKFVGVQDAYNNPSGDVSYVDGLAPYYSSIRPGAFEISEPPPAASSKINHLDVLYAFEMWDKVQPQIEYCWNNPVLRVKDPSAPPQDIITPEGQTVSSYRMVQGKQLTFVRGDRPTAQLILVGDYSGSQLNVYDGSILIKSISVKEEVTGFFNAFQAIRLDELQPGRSYTLSCDQPMTALLDDGDAVTLEIQSEWNHVFYSGEPLKIKAIIGNASEAMKDIVVNGYLNRNLDENGRRVNGMNVPVSFQYDETEQDFVCQGLPDLPKGIYNLSVFAEGAKTHRFATSSIALLRDRREEFKQPGKIHIYPNPASESVTLSCMLPSGGNTEVRIYDLSGKLVLQKELGNLNPGTHTSVLSLNCLGRGIYLVQLIGPEFQVQEKLCVF